MKKKILVVNHQMQLGGVCIAAKNFIENMKDDYEIEYMLAKPNGELDNRLPSEIKVSYIPYPLCVASMNRKKELKEKGNKFFLKKITILAFLKIFNSSFIAKKVCNQTKRNEEYYDIVINNDMDMEPRAFGACHAYTKHLVKAKLKLLVCHGDFLANKYDVKFFKKEFIPVYDYIVTLSNPLKKQLVDLYPEFKNKFVVIPNFAATYDIKKLSLEQDIKFKDDCINIISASRLTELKGIMRSLSVFKQLKNEGFKFCWYILGEGEQRPQIEEYIKTNNLDDCVKLLGLKSNPYPYMKAADILYLGSYHESYGLVLVESMILGRPVITTKTASAEEVVDKNFGWICDNNEDGIFNAFKDIFSDSKKLKEKTKNLKDYEYDNKSIKQKYDDLIGR